jgi:hypothetical protein
VSWALTCLSLATFAPAASAQDDTRRADAQQLHEAAERARPIVRSLQEGGFSDYAMGAVGESLTQARQAVGHVEGARRLEEQVRPLHARFVAAYPVPEGQSPEYAIRQRFQDVVTWPVDADLREVGQFLEFFRDYPARAGRRCVEILEARGTNEEAIRGLHEIYRTRAILEARQLLDVCPRFAPDDAQLAQQMEALRPRVEATLARFREEEIAAIRDREWPAGGGPAAQSAAALAYLRGHPLLGAHPTRNITVLAVTVRGDWAVAERDLFGQPISYGLPVYVGLTSNFTVEGVAQVLELTLISTEARPSAPWDGYWAGDTWLILRERVPGQRGAAAPPAAGGAARRPRR